MRKTLKPEGRSVYYPNATKQILPPAKRAETPIRVSYRTITKDLALVETFTPAGGSQTRG
ncbi:MAG: hypothetical protein M3Y27_10255 [Acidobacteriota bacterium]|nr:hypothetical protein [Acidobacteriota bacterium]